MYRYIVKILLALALAVLIYSLGVPGCSPTGFMNVETVSCEEFSSVFQVESCMKVSGETAPEKDRTEEEPEDEISNVFDKDPRDKDWTERSDKDWTPREKTPLKDLLEFDYTISLGKVDIIFVIDNSSSMAMEHRSLADQFDSFLSDLKNVDYHIAVITTDISRSPDNPVRNAIYQDGKFLPIGRRIFLRNENIGGKPSSDVKSGFQRAVERKETIACDDTSAKRSSGGSRADDFHRRLNPRRSLRCPSHDERGTYALNEALRNPTHRAFFRADAHLIVVILSDEDIRSGEEYRNQYGNEIYALEDLDKPEVLIENLYNRFPLKSVRFFPIIIDPGDGHCFDEQYASRAGGEGSGRGYYGVEYARLAEDQGLRRYGNLLEGKVISICDRNYGSQLSNIAVDATTAKVPLPCGNPYSVALYIDGDRTRIDYSIEERTLVIEPGEVRLTADLRLKVRCEAE